MGGKNFHRNRFNKGRLNLSLYTILVREKKLIEAKLPFLTCKIYKNLLVCSGQIGREYFSQDYEIKIEYNGINTPKVFIINPEIEYNEEIHMFPKDKSLCLFHPETDNFYWSNQKHHLFDSVILWAFEWLVYYELYLISGKWEHPYVDHRTQTYHYPK